MNKEEIQINSEELQKEKSENFKERLWFINYWTEYIKSHSDEDWSKQQKVLIDSQIENSRALAKNKQNP